MAINPITLERPSADEAPLQDRLNEALIQELLDRTRSAGFALLGAVTLLWMFIGERTGTLVSVLFLVLVGITLFRFVVVTWLHRRTRKRVHHMRVFIWFASMSLLIGSTLGAIVMASYLDVPPLAVALCLIAILGIHSASMLSLSGSPLVYLVHVGPSMAALIFVAFAHPMPGFERAYQTTQIIYAAASLAMMRGVHRSLRTKIMLQLRLAASVDRLRDTQAQLVEASRQAGRADVAAEMLHGVGNVLNSVNVSATLVAEIVARSKTNNLSKVIGVVMEHRADFGQFFRDDPRGQKLPEYFTQLAEVVERDNRTVRSEMASLTKNIDHIAALVGSQQAQVRRSDVVETFDVHRLLEDALAPHAVSCDQQSIEVVRRFDELPSASLDRHKAMQILIVLLANARDAVMKRLGGRRIVVRARRATSGDLEIVVEDNGCGIDPANLDRIFGLGFTTKRDGHGLGLHYSACAARELKGSLTVHSAGLGGGAEFSLVLPFAAASAGSTAADSH